MAEGGEALSFSNTSDFSSTFPCRSTSGLVTFGTFSAGVW